MFCEESFGLELFRNGSLLKFGRLKALITLKRVNTSVVEKKKKNKNKNKTKQKKKNQNLRLRSFEMIQIRISDPRSLGSW